MHMMSTEQSGRLFANARRWHKLGGLALALALVGTGCGAIPKVNVVPEGETVTSESGTSVALTITLARRPLGPIEVYAKSSNEHEGVVSSSVHFDPSHWNQPQVIRVTGVDDATNDGDVAYDITLYARSAHDAQGVGTLVTTLHFINRDNDEAALFQALGDLPGGESASQVSGLSAAGDVVVGWSGSDLGTQPFRWTEVLGLKGLAGPGRALAVSPDGQLVTGSVPETSFGRTRGTALWRGDGPFELLATTPDPRGQPPIFLPVDGTVVLDDGRVYGNCIQYGAYNEPIACRFDDPDHLVNFPFSYVYAADATGRYAGTAQSERHAPFSTRPIYSEWSIGYPVDIVSTCAPYVGCQAAARAFSADGTVVVGTSSIPALNATPATPQRFETALVFTQTEGALRLPDLDGGAQASGAYAISADGHLIAGFATDERGQQAAVWLGRSPKALEDLLLEAGGTLPDGWSLEDVRAVSADGRILVGNGVNPAGNPEGFRIVLPKAP